MTLETRDIIGIITCISIVAFTAYLIYWDMAGRDCREQFGIFLISPDVPQSNSYDSDSGYFKCLESKGLPVLKKFNTK